MSFPYSQPVTLITRTVTGSDGYGNDVYGETSVTVKGALAPGPSSELVQGQDLLTSQPAVYIPAGVAVTAVDAVVVGGLRYDVDGSPNEWVSPFTGWQPGTVVRLKRVTG